MLPLYSVPYQQYFLFSSISSSGNSILVQNNNPFFVQSFLPQPSLLSFNSTSETYNPFSNNSLPQLTSFYKLQELNQQQKEELQKSQNRTFKEKGIKKVSNRPANYVTERSFYLSQALKEQNKGQRTLRPRNKKKKNMKSKEGSSLDKQTQISQQKKSSKPIKTEQGTLKELLTQQKAKQSLTSTLKQEQQEEVQFRVQLWKKERAQVRTELIQKKQQ